MKMNILKESFKSAVLGGVGSGAASALIAFYLIGMPADVVENVVNNGMAGLFSGAISGFIGAFVAAHIFGARQEEQA
ncbi:MAG TPA: hypothetical protein VFW68_05690 [Rhodocyclaceae bacterium]|nr:hypothetical protein [Rhodocyclaceae bacterium]